MVFELTFYKDDAAAKAAAAKKNPKTTALVENGVVDFKGNPSIYKGAPPAKISKLELDAIKDLHRQVEVARRRPVRCSRPRRGEVPNRVRSGRKQP